MPLITETPHSIEDAPGDLPPEPVVFGNSEGMQAVRRTLQRVATSSAPVLVLGETGTGKEIIAKQLHLLSPWHASPLFKINCPLLRTSPGANDPLGESLMSMGNNWYTQDQPVPRTTLFLDEIALLNPAAQLSLLEKLQEGPLLRVGFPEGGTIELRLVCGTSRQLEQEVKAGTFLRELYYAIKVIAVELPPLRQRRSDIPQLTGYFLDLYNRKFQTQTQPPPSRIMRLMGDYLWPGNIRELENLIIRYTVQGSEGAFSGELGNRPLGRGPAGATSATTSMKEVARQAVQELEQKIIRTVLEQHHWNRKQTARALNISYRALLYKIKAAGVPPKRIVRADRQSRPRDDNPPLAGGQKREDTAA